MIPVTQSFLPPEEEFFRQLKRVYKTNWVTNRGELVQELEEKLIEHLGINNLLLTANGTISLQIALKILGNNSEIITTPFSYIATASSIVWENCIPVFVDIDPTYLTIDESKIEPAITNRTSCILATHVYGSPCNIEAIDAISKKYNIPVIYDASHCFGVKYNSESIFNFGDISTCSFHATKLFHTGEGGAIVSNNKNLTNRIYYSHNFGHKGTLDYWGLGINGKLSELHAAMGLAILPYMHEIIEERRKIVNTYNGNINFTSIRNLTIREKTEWNYSYYPLIFHSEKQLLEIEQKLNEENIFPRRYFYPSLNTIEYLRSSKMTVSEDIACRILCLPLYKGLAASEIEKIITIINNNL